MIEKFYCNSKVCSKKDSCYRRKEKLLAHINSDWEELVGEDCHRICNESRMYTTSYDGISNHSIEYLEPLFNFLDNVCIPETCTHAHPYPKSPQDFSSRLRLQKR